MGIDDKAATVLEGDRTISDTALPSSSSVPAVSPVTVTSAGRSTVLPRVVIQDGSSHVSHEGRPRYQAVRPLGSGGQAEVTLEVDHDIDRTVAVKRLRPERADGASVLRFAEEVRTVGQLDHPNIVPIHDVGVDEEGRYFFVMKHVDGETMESIIARLRAGDVEYVRRYSVEFRLQILNELLRGIEHAHRLGFIHRDLKPANVMVGPLGEVVIMDWGLAKKVGAPEPARADGPTPEPAAGRGFETHAGAVLGTPAYMAPEQARGQVDAIDERSDVYSLGVVIYEFLSLRHPRGDISSGVEMLTSIMGEPIDVTRMFGDFIKAGVPLACAHFLRDALERDPNERYQSVQAMRERLEAVRDRRAPIQCPMTFTQRALDGLARFLNSHPYVLLLLLTTIALSILFGVYKLVALAIHLAAH